MELKGEIKRSAVFPHFLAFDNLVTLSVGEGGKGEPFLEEAPKPEYKALSLDKLVTDGTLVVLGRDTHSRL